jgi:hypothetical protein
MEPIVKRFLAELIRWALKPPSQPGPFKLKVVAEEFKVGGVTYVDSIPTGEITIMKKNVTVITMPALPEGNPEGVVTRKFTVNSTDLTFSQDFTVPSDYVVTVKLAQGVEVTLSLTDVDQAGNNSVPRTYTFTPSDVTPPSQPGEFQMVVTSEEE